MELNINQNEVIAHLESYDLTLEVCLLINNYLVIYAFREEPVRVGTLKAMVKKMK